MELIPYPSEQAGKDKVEQDKQEFKEMAAIGYPIDYDDYDMFPMEMEEPF